MRVSWLPAGVWYLPCSGLDSWNMAGNAVEGELAESQLQPLASRSSFWFALIATFPDIELS